MRPEPKFPSNDVDSLQQLLYLQSVLSTINKQNKFQGKVSSKMSNILQEVAESEHLKIDQICAHTKKSSMLCYQI